MLIAELQIVNCRQVLAASMRSPKAELKMLATALVNSTSTQRYPGVMWLEVKGGCLKPTENRCHTAPRGMPGVACLFC